MSEFHNPSDLRVRALETARFLHQQAPFAELNLEDHAALQNMGAELEKGYRAILQDRQTNPNHLLTATYSLQNIDSRPDNSLLLVDDASIILNISASQVMVIEEDASAEAVHFVYDLLTQLAEVFVFATGQNFIKLLDGLEYDHRSNNVIFKHEGIDMEQLDHSIDQGQFVNLVDYDHDHWSEEEIAAFGLALWGYDLEDVRQLENPHIVVVNDKGQPMAGARANAVTDPYAVVGGVITLKAFRQQGLGSAVSQVLTAELRQQGYLPVLETDEDNFPALKIYEKLGYERVGHSVFLDIGTNRIAEIRGDRSY